MDMPLSQILSVLDRIQSLEFNRSIRHVHGLCQYEREAKKEKEEYFFSLLLKFSIVFSESNQHLLTHIQNGKKISKTQERERKKERSVSE